jgi:hypothetical protein
MTKFQAIRAYFSPPEVTTSELKNLPAEDRAELAELAAKELGVTLDPTPTINK